jgi:hypothetical protein
MNATGNSTGMGTYLVNDGPDNLFDNSSKTMYTSRGNSSDASKSYAGLNTGFYVTVGPCPSVLLGFFFTTTDSSVTFDPQTITIEGSDSVNLNIGTSWTLIYSGPTGLADVADRGSDGIYESIDNSNTYKSYRFLVTSKRGPNGQFVSYSEVKLYGRYIVGTTPSPGKSLHFSFFLQEMMEAAIFQKDFDVNSFSSTNTI